MTRRRDSGAARGDLLGGAANAACRFGARRAGDPSPGSNGPGPRRAAAPRDGPAVPSPDPKAAKRARSSTSYHAGLAAEESVARRYARAGLTVEARRWRGKAGEIDLIARDGDALVFVEVKASGSHDGAAARLLPRQARRLMGAAEEFLATQPLGALTPCRFDLATVDGRGRVRVIPNAFGH